MRTDIQEREFPIQAERYPRWGAQHVRGPLSVPWDRAAEAYYAYSTLYGTSQSLERMAERGGFGWFEFLGLHRVYRWMKALEASGRKYTHAQLHALLDRAFFDQGRE